MREFCIGTSAITVEGGELHCEYSVLVEESGGNLPCECYGIQVRMPKRDELASVRNLTINAARILELGDLLCRNRVTPCTLRDVIEDWL